MGRYKRTAIICASIFCIALGVRLLHWQDNRDLFPLSGMSGEYKSNAQLLLAGDVATFVRGVNPPSDASVIGHPPGYPIFLAFIFKTIHGSDAAARFVQAILGAIAALLIYFIACELLTGAVAAIAGVLVALSPQLGMHSILLLPDSLAVLPILLAVYCIVRAHKRPRLALIIAAGVFIGLSCWLRSNALLLAPFLALFVPLLFSRGERWRYALALVGVPLLIIAPITVRNYLVFDRFIPLSLGAGVTLVEGIAEYDTKGKFGLPSTDYGISMMDSRTFNRPDYASSLFTPDGIEREQARFRRGLEVIRSNPVWFLSVMVRRAGSMLRLERVQIISPEPAVSHSLGITADRQPIRTLSPEEMVANSVVNAGQAEMSLAEDKQSWQLTGDDSKWGEQVVSAPITVEVNADYIIRVPLKVEQGSVIITVKSVNLDSVIASTRVLHVVEDIPREKQPVVPVHIPFVSRNTDKVRIVLSNGGSKPLRPVLQVGSIETFPLGPATYTWVRYPRLIISSIQKVFITACILPLVILGIIFLIRERQTHTLIILLAVPVYYLGLQSALHTEYRYVLAIHYFLFVIAAVTIHRAGRSLCHRALRTSVIAKRGVDVPSQHSE